MGGTLRSICLAPLLAIDNLTVAVGDASQSRAAVGGVSLQLFQGEVLGLLGESGCGKTTLAFSMLGIFTNGAHMLGGSIRFDGRDLLTLSEREARKLRGAKIAMIPQEPLVAFNPVLRVGAQIAEMIRAHRALSGNQCRTAARAALAEVGFDAPERIASAYPHQLSGGQLQRAAIAQAIACRPQLLIADEPTSSLDPKNRDEILALLKRVRNTSSMSLLLITHQPGMLAGFADRVAVMLGGEIVECGDARRVLQRPSHPYTRELLGCQDPASADDALAPLVKHVSQVAEDFDYAQKH